MTLSTAFSSPNTTSSTGPEFDPDGIHWHFLSPDGRSWLDRVTTGKHCEQLVKKSVRRWVRRYPPDIYVKQVEYAGLRAIGKSLAGGNACREGATYLQLAHHGIAVPEVLGYGSERRFSVLKRDVLITREVGAAQSLAHYMQDGYRTLEPKAKRALTANLATFVRRLHDQGVVQKDLHVGNLLLRCADGVHQFVLMDAQRVTIRSRSLSLSQRLLNLAVLLCSFWHIASTSQCLRFLRDYGLHWNDARGRSHLFRIKQLALKLARRSWDAHARQALGNNARFITERRNGFRIHRLRRDHLKGLLDHLLPDPERFVDQGRRGSPTQDFAAARTSFEGRWYSIKPYHPQGWFPQLENAWRGNRAQRTWLNSWAMRMRQLPVPEPLLCMHERRFFSWQRSYLVTESVGDVQPLSHCWRELDPVQRRDVLIHLGMQLGRLHRFGGIHGNLVWDNLLIGFSGDDLRLILGELDEARMIPPASPLRRLMDIRVFLWDLGQRDPDGRYRRLFLDTWNRWR